MGRVRGGAEVVAPDALEDLAAVEHLLGILEEQLEQRELRQREAEPDLAADLPGIEGRLFLLVRLRGKGIEAGAQSRIILPS